MKLDKFADQLLKELVPKLLTVYFTFQEMMMKVIMWGVGM